MSTDVASKQSWPSLSRRGAAEAHAEAPVAAANLTPEMTKLTGIEGRLAAIEKEFGIKA